MNHPRSRRAIVLVLSALMVSTPAMMRAQQPLPFTIASVPSGQQFNQSAMTYEGAWRPALPTTLAGASCGSSPYCTTDDSDAIFGLDASGNSLNGSAYLFSLDPTGSNAPPAMWEVTLDNDLASGSLSPSHTLFSQIPQSKLIQQANWVFDGHSEDGGGNRAGGVMITDIGGTSYILATVFTDFGVSPIGKTHFVLSKNLSSPAVVYGPREVSGTGYTHAQCVTTGNGGSDCPDGWVGQTCIAIPAPWQGPLGGDTLCGMQDSSIIGRTSHGPAAVVFTRSCLASGDCTGKKLVGYDGPVFSGAHWTRGWWTTGDGSDTPPGLQPGQAGGTGQSTSQNDWNRMFIPTGYDSLVFVTVRGDPDKNCYGGMVAGDADGDPVTRNIGETEAVQASGTMTFTNGSSTITGAGGSKFLTEFPVGTRIQATTDDSKRWTVSAVASDTSMTVSGTPPDFSGTWNSMRVVEGANAEVDNTGFVIKLPYVNTDAITTGHGHGYIGLAGHATPATVYAGRNYQGMSKILSSSNSGTANASVTVREEFTNHNATGVTFAEGAPSCYGPDFHGDTGSDDTPGAHTVGAYPYQVFFEVYRLSDLARVAANLDDPWELLPVDEWTVTLPIQVVGATGKYADTDLGSVQYDTNRNKIILGVRRGHTQNAIYFANWGVAGPRPVVVPVWQPIFPLFDLTGRPRPRQVPSLKPFVTAL